MSLRLIHEEGLSCVTPHEYANPLTLSRPAPSSMAGEVAFLPQPTAAGKTWTNIDLGGGGGGGGRNFWKEEIDWGFQVFFSGVFCGGTDSFSPSSEDPVDLIDCQVILYYITVLKGVTYCPYCSYLSFGSTAN